MIIRLGTDLSTRLHARIFKEEDHGSVQLLHKASWESDTHSIQERTYYAFVNQRPAETDDAYEARLWRIVRRLNNMKDNSGGFDWEIIEDLTGED